MRFLHTLLPVLDNTLLRFPISKQNSNSSDYKKKKNSSDMGNRKSVLSKTGNKVCKNLINNMSDANEIDTNNNSYDESP
jgi:hypothetical protein